MAITASRPSWRKTVCTTAKVQSTFTCMGAVLDIALSDCKCYGRNPAICSGSIVLGWFVWSRSGGMMKVTKKCQ
eukprot:4927155-Amphidinium_carterae.1